MASHYNTMITKAKTAYDVYPGFTWTKPVNVTAKSTIIKADQYPVPFASPVGIKNFVNSGYGATLDTRKQNLIQLERLLILIQLLQDMNM